MCAHETRFPRRSELGAGVECPGAEVSYSFKPSDLTWVLGNELRSSTKAGQIFGFLLGFGFIKRWSNVAQARLEFHKCVALPGMLVYNTGMDLRIL